MKWVIEDGLHTCQISAEIEAHVWDWTEKGGWIASIVSGGFAIWETTTPTTEAAAKTAVCHWIGRTMAQFSNALAMGCNDLPDDGA